MSLARVVAYLAGLAVVASLVAAALGHSPGLIVIAVQGLIVVVAIAFEARRYSPRVVRSNPAWQKTDERFIDPTSGKIVDVYVDPASGTRDYRTPSA